MAVFTPIDKSTLESFLTNYDVGNIINFEEMRNSQYKIWKFYLEWLSKS